MRQRFQEREWWEHDAELADVVGSLRQRPAEGGEHEDRHHRPSKLFSDNADAILQIKQLGDAFDMVSGDALWDVKYMTDGLIDPMDLSTIDASKELYSVAKSFEFWTNPKGYLGVPVLVVDRADLLQPRHGQDTAELMAVAHRPCVQGHDRCREHPDRPAGDRRPCREREGSVRHDRGRAVGLRPTSSPRSSPTCSSWHRRTTRSSSCWPTSRWRSV